MTAWNAPFPDAPAQYRAILVLCLAVAVPAFVLAMGYGDIFQRFIGPIDPRLAAPALFGAGAGALALLVRGGWFRVYAKENRKGLALACALAALFGTAIVVFDLIVVYPKDQNIAFPVSLLFYPTVGFFAEILFHLLPLAILVSALRALLPKASRERILWIAILIVALIEPTYQAVVGAGAHHFPLWAAAYEVAHIFLISLSQLLLFRRYDFASMYALRLAYYLIWHIGWGYLRLQILF